MEFRELEDARQAYLQEPNDDTRHELGVMVNKLVEPIMAKMGLWWEAEAYYNAGQLVFSNHDDMEVIIDPRGSRGGYDLKISPLVGAEDDFEVIEDTFGSMKGVTQFIYDLENPHADGMVGEPEAQTELPLEHKMRITKSQLQKIIKEEAAKALNESDVMAKVWEMSDAILEVMEPQQAFENLIQALGRDLAEDHLGYIIQQYEIPYGDDEVEDYDEDYDEDYNPEDDYNWPGHKAHY
jgi:hypothetical protein